MKPLFNLVLGITSGILLLSGCQAMQQNSMQPNISAKPIGMANPASVYCINQGGQSFIKKDSQGAEAGYCRLTNGDVVDEWDFYRQHIPITTVPSSTNTQTVADNTTLIITYEAGKKANALQAVTAMQGKIVYDYKNLNMLAVAFDTTDIEAVRQQLEQQPGILAVQRNQQVHTLS